MPTTNTVPATWAKIHLKGQQSIADMTPKPRMSWADEKEEEEEELALKKNFKMELEVKNIRIRELELELKEEKVRHEELKSKSWDLATEIEKLKSMNGQQVEKAEILKSEVEKKDTLILKLELALQEKVTRLGELEERRENHAGSIVDPPPELEPESKSEPKPANQESDHDIEGHAETPNFDAETKEDKAASSVSNETSSEGLFSTPNTINDDGIECKATTVPTDGSVSNSATTLIEEPVLCPPSPKSKLAQHSTPKPAPVLSFPVNLMNKPAESDQGKEGGWTSGAKIQDIRDMSLKQREELFRGPSISIYIGQVAVRHVPKRMFMQVSKKACNYFTQHPQESSVQVAPTIAVPAVHHIVDWLTDMGSCHKIYSIPFRGDNFMENLAVRRAARTLGMDRYVGHFTKHYCDYIRNGLPSFDNMALIEKLCERDDAVFDCLANNLAHLKIMGQIPNVRVFDKFMEKHPRLASTVEMNCAKIVAFRKARADTERQQHIIDANSSQSTPRKEWKTVENVGKQAASPLKLEGNLKSLRVVSAEEARDMPRRQR
ncbi:hypothetical protein CC78DRAFT_576715 [Lojkania enalia]|uniref:Uncharacterized protein n=1 Tax=Lojkania enalia TaxID=147567 RepID=A0A9P4N918_9PLEO|nr:hypothetical protein CC78DRAFT_576715 [Didymosphaeria enalia]